MRSDCFALISLVCKALDVSELRATHTEVGYSQQKLPSNKVINHKQNAIDSGGIFGLSRYGHPDGPVHLPADREHFDPSKDPWSKYSPTWEQFSELWDQLEPADRRRQMPIHILTLADNPSDLLTGYSEDLQPDPARRSAEQTRINDPLATVVCAPTMTIKVAERLESKGYKVDPLTLVFFRAKPIPFESKDEGMIIRLEFPPRPRDLWFLQDEQPAGHEHLTNLTKGRISMESILLHVKVIDGIPTILSFARSEDLAESMKLSFENNYWKHRFQDAEGRDILRRLPLPFFWYAVRRWDEVSEIVDTFIGSLETVFDTQTAQQLRALRTHLLYCEVLLKRFRDTLAIIRRTSQDKIVGNEFWKLLVEIERLEAERGMHEGRAKHVIDSIYSQSAVIAAGASIRDSRDMKQVSRLTMLFLPASVMAGIFGINSALFDAETSLLFYFILTIPLTVVIIWVFVAMQVEHYFLDFPTGAWYYRVLWPLYMFRRGVRIADSILV